MCREGRSNVHLDRVEKPMNRIKQLFADEPSWLARVQVLSRTLLMVARGFATFASCTVLPRPVLRGRHVQLINRQQIDI